MSIPASRTTSRCSPMWTPQKVVRGKGPGGRRLRIRSAEVTASGRTGCGKRGADFRPDFNWNKASVKAMCYRRALLATSNRDDCWNKTISAAVGSSVGLLMPTGVGQWEALPTRSAKCPSTAPRLASKQSGSCLIVPNQQIRALHGGLGTAQRLLSTLL